MEGPSLLLAFCAAMFAGAYIAGVVPLRISVNASRLRLITIFGAGLLVGTALIVIIPEGVAMHYQSQLSHPHEAEAPAALPPGVKLAEGGSKRLLTQVAEAVLPDAASGTVSDARPRALAAEHDHSEAGHDHSEGTDDSSAGGSHAGHTHTAGQWQIGAALSLGFAFQVVVDRLSGGLHGHGHGHGDISEDDEEGADEEDGSNSDSSDSSSEDVEAGKAGGKRRSGGPRRQARRGSAHGFSVPHRAHHAHAHGHHVVARAGGAASPKLGAAAGDINGAAMKAASEGASVAVLASAGGGAGGGAAGSTSGSATTSAAAYAATQASRSAAKSKSALAGLVVHAMVDGVALGAAVREGDSALGMLVFLAIILHKAPSSFGLTSYLMHQGLTRDAVLRRLLIFSCAAPAGALATYAFLSTNLFTYKQEMLALCLLFSGGTFLYVATAHILPEIQAHGPGSSDGDDDGEGKAEGGKMSWLEVGVLVAGVLCPLLIDVHGGHGH